MKLIVGLGNPERRYNGTRHNVGFAMLDDFAVNLSLEFQTKDKFKAATAELKIDGETTLLIKPLTYYNDSGLAVRLIADFYKVSEADILVIHDELALPFGTVRTRIGGSDAGNNGVKSVTQHIGQGTARIRIGIYNELRDRIDDADFVLSTFTASEADAFEPIKTTVLAAISNFIDGSFETTTHA